MVSTLSTETVLTSSVIDPDCGDEDTVCTRVTVCHGEEMERGKCKQSANIFT